MPVTRQQLAWAAGGILCAILLVWVVQSNLQGVSYQLLGWQRDLHRSLTLAITELSRTPSTGTWMTLLGVSFAYGVFHAAAGTGLCRSYTEIILPWARCTTNSSDKEFASSEGPRYRLGALAIRGAVLGQEFSCSGLSKCSPGGSSS